MLPAIMLIAVGGSLLYGALKDVYPWCPWVEAFGGTCDKPSPGSAADSAFASAAGNAVGGGTGTGTGTGAPTNGTAARGTYDDPLRDISGLTPERCDQGVDYSGNGPIYAVGPGRVIHVAASGFSGAWVSYILTGGRRSGSAIFVAEGITPRVRVGQHVDANTVIAEMHGGIEMGFARPQPCICVLTPYNGAPDGTPMPGGKAFSRFMQGLGGIGGTSGCP